MISCSVSNKNITEAVKGFFSRSVDFDFDNKLQYLNSFYYLFNVFILISIL